MSRQRSRSVKPARRDDDAPSTVTPAELEASLRSVEPDAFWTAPRILRRVIREHYGATGFAVQTPHRKSCTIAGAPLSAIVSPAELGLAPNASLPEEVILLARPEPEFFETATRAEGLLYLWRLLFHAKIDQAIERERAAGRLTAEELRRRVEQIGPARFDEIRAILAEEHYLLPPRDEAVVYREFAAVFFELSYFSRGSISHFFPAIGSPGAIERILQQDVNAKELFAATRPAGVETPTDAPELSELDEWVIPPEEAEAAPFEPSAVEEESRSELKHRALCERAERASAVGNTVRAALLFARAERISPPRRVSRTRALLRAEQDRLVRRLAGALDLPDATTYPWQESISMLVRHASAGLWTVEGRFLYDLQKVCVDHERALSTIDLAGWLLSFGRRPLKRPLPNHGDILISKHLRTAFRRLAAVRLSFPLRQHLAELLRGGMETAELRIRECFRPKIVAVLDEQGFLPHNLPERVSRKKLVEELLDRIVLHGYLNLGDLRDAVSRNHLKLPDVLETACRFENNSLARPFRRLYRRWTFAAERAAVQPWLWMLLLLGRIGGWINRFAIMPIVAAYAGSPLLRIDRRLARSLDGVYHRGEIYLRIMQRLVALGFATRVGRFLTRFFLVPFGGAFVLLKGVDHLTEKISGPGRECVSGTSVGALGLFLLALLNSEAFRLAVWRAAKRGFHFLRYLLIDLPNAVLRLPFVRRILDSRWFSWTVRFGFKPLIVTALLRIVLPGASLKVEVWNGVLLFLAVNLAINSRIGRTTEEIVVDYSIQAWHRFGIRPLAAMFSIVMEFFKQLVETIERLLYSVDEWLRFKSGDNRWTLCFKALFGLVWGWLAYVVRFCVTLLLEPQVNPIKHFPVVTVSHKMLFPLIPVLGGWVEQTMGVEKAEGIAMATVFIWSIPGVFGFLVWELKENWRLFAANRNRNLSPVHPGDHGETMGRMLRRGFHSGTLPKRFAKLRRAERKARRTGNWKAVRKHLHALQHIAVLFHRYIEREFIELLREAGAWSDGNRTQAVVQLSAQSVRFVLQPRGENSPPLVIAYHVRSGRLAAGAHWPTDDAAASALDRRLTSVAVLGLHCTADVDWVYQRIESELPPQAAYDFTEDGLVVRLDPSSSSAISIPIAGDDASARNGAAEARPMVPDRLAFRTVAVAWSDWAAYWDSCGETSLPDEWTRLSGLLLAECREPSCTAAYDAAPRA